jgi:hypothetical protein
MIDPYVEAGKWAWPLLKADAGIIASNAGIQNRIWPEPPVPDGETYPFIVFEDQGQFTNIGPGGVLIWFQVNMLVKAIHNVNDSLTLAPITSAIYAALSAKPGSTDVARIISCAALSPFRMRETGQEDDFLYLHQGHLFQVRIQPIV